MFGTPFLVRFSCYGGEQCVPEECCSVTHTAAGRSPVTTGEGWNGRMTDDLRDEFDFSDEELRNVIDLTLLSGPTVPSGKTRSRQNIRASLQFSHSGLHHYTQLSPMAPSSCLHATAAIPR